MTANLYNPHEQGKQQLLDRFAARHDIFRELYQSMTSAVKTGARRHVLLEGARGTGKTTLLLRLNYELENDAELRASCVPIVLKEEAYYGIRRLHALWKIVAQEWQQKDQAVVGLYERMCAAYHPDAAARTGEKQYEIACFDLLNDALNAHAKTLALFIDNFGELLYNFTGQEMYRLYKILKDDRAITLIAASSIALEALKNDENGFLYALFEKKRLDGLSKAETHALLLELGRNHGKEEVIERLIAAQPGRIESLRILTGGVIRTMVLLFDVLIEAEQRSALTDLDVVLDRVTPLYKSRMDMLSPLQRELVNLIALHWEAISADELARQANLSSDDAQAILLDLEHVFLIERVSDAARQPLFRLKERFFNIWYLMRLSVGSGHARVTWLLHFLESWYNKTELHDVAYTHLHSVSAGKCPPAQAFYLTEALVKTGVLDRDIEHQMLTATKRLLRGASSDMEGETTPSDHELFEHGQLYYRQEMYEQAAAFFLKIVRKDAHVHFRLGYALMKLGRVEDALSHFRQAAKMGHLEAVLHLGFAHDAHLRDYAKAKRFYGIAAAKGHTDAMLNLGNLCCYTLQEYDEARKYYLMAAKTGQERLNRLSAANFSLTALKRYVAAALKGSAQDTEQCDIEDIPGARRNYRHAMRQTTAEALYQLGNLHVNALRNAEKAERYYRMAAQAGHVKAMLYLGDWHYFTRNDARQAEKYYLMAAKQDNLDALVNLGLLYHTTLNNAKKAEKCYRAAAQKGEVSAMNGLAWLYFEQKRDKADALEYARRALRMQPNMHTAHTAACIYLWNGRTSEAFAAAEQFMFSGEAHQLIEKDIVFYLLLVIAHAQYEQALRYFRASSPDLRERFAPVFYALLYFIGEPQYENLPPEFAEPVREIIERIHQLASDYNDPR